MSKNNNIALIYYLGENKPNLISQITSYLTEIEGQFSGVTFATLGRVCELTMIYQKADKQNFDEIVDFDFSSVSICTLIVFL